MTDAMRDHAGSVAHAVRHGFDQGLVPTLVAVLIQPPRAQRRRQRVGRLQNEMFVRRREPIVVRGGVVRVVSRAERFVVGRRRRRRRQQSRQSVVEHGRSPVPLRLRRRMLDDVVREHVLRDLPRGRAGAKVDPSFEVDTVARPDERQRVVSRCQVRQTSRDPLILIGSRAPNELDRFVVEKGASRRRGGRAAATLSQNDLDGVAGNDSVVRGRHQHGPRRAVLETVLHVGARRPHQMQNEVDCREQERTQPANGAVVQQISQHRRLVPHAVLELTGN